MTKILIISTPPGFAPEHIRKQWVNIEIPLLGIEDPQKPLGNRSGTENLGGYQVLPKDAIDALEKAGKHEAVEFWTPYLRAQNFTFKKEVCTLIEWRNYPRKIKDLHVFMQVFFTLLFFETNIDFSL